MSGALDCSSFKQQQEIQEYLVTLHALGCVAVAPATWGLGTLVCMVGTYYTWKGVFDNLDYLQASDDHALITKLFMDDCGGLSKMVSSAQGCFRKHLTPSICRQENSPNFDKLKNRFQKCFANRYAQCGYGKNRFTIQEVLAAGK